MGAQDNVRRAQVTHGLVMALPAQLAAATWRTVASAEGFRLKTKGRQQSIKPTKARKYQN